MPSFIELPSLLMPGGRLETYPCGIRLLSRLKLLFPRQPSNVPGLHPPAIPWQPLALQRPGLPPNLLASPRTSRFPCRFPIQHRLGGRNIGFVIWMNMNYIRLSRRAPPKTGFNTRDIFQYQADMLAKRCFRNAPSSSSRLVGFAKIAIAILSGAILMLYSTTGGASRRARRYDRSSPPSQEYGV
ncbi:hypothetical protein C8F04DRAFT_655247 [Mycena alexandri]|uniref:Uncharacterized protein n=1 Tax=Mycena alexandri TaxID=1745969 RepID=A0AAD6ST32_9AGAR|nr:hypothetical protein C8F04DRAFT_655247 [Mycena alexandri]